MNDSSAVKLDWLDKLSTNNPHRGLGDLQGMPVLTTARGFLPETVVEWALTTAAEVADEVDEVDELRRSESIVARHGTGKLERMVLLQSWGSRKTGVK